MSGTEVAWVNWRGLNVANQFKICSRRVTLKCHMFGCIYVHMHAQKFKTEDTVRTQNPRVKQGWHAEDICMKG
jgi:hypothetical protein